jgi:hypothetical protein
VLRYMVRSLLEYSSFPMPLASPLGLWRACSGEFASVYLGDGVAPPVLPSVRGKQPWSSDPESTSEIRACRFKIVIVDPGMYGRDWIPRIPSSYRIRTIDGGSNGGGLTVVFGPWIPDPVA